MLVIVDGPDGAGKTTLVAAVERELVRLFPRDEVVLFHKRPPTAHPLAEYVEPLLGYRPWQQTHVVCDRWHWGEAIYPQVLERPTRLDGAVWRYTEMFLRSRGALAVFPDVSASTLQERVRARGDDLVTPEMLPRLSTAYRHVAMRSKLPVYRYSAHLDNDLARVAHNILEEANRLERAAAVVNPFHTYVGPPRPDVLLVGDERPPRMDRDHPAFMPYAPRSGHYLLSALTGPRLHNLGIVNANDGDDVLEAYLALGEPSTVVALGREASRTLTRVGVEHSAVPHPQFVRRFYQRHRDEYGVAIDDAMASRLNLLSWRPRHPSWRPV